MTKKGGSKGRPVSHTGKFQKIRSDFSQMTQGKVETDVAIKNRELLKKK